MLRGPTPVGVLARLLGKDRTTLTRNAALLQEKGWITAEQHGEDGRSHVLSVTSAGQALAREALPAWRGAQESTVANVPSRSRGSVLSGAPPSRGKARMP